MLYEFATSFWMEIKPWTGCASWSPWSLPKKTYKTCATSMRRNGKPRWPKLKSPDGYNIKQLLMSSTTGLNLRQNSFRPCRLHYFYGNHFRVIFFSSYCVFPNLAPLLLQLPFGRIWWEQVWPKHFCRRGLQNWSFAEAKTTHKKESFIYIYIYINKWKKSTNNMHYFLVSPCANRAVFAAFRSKYGGGTC